MAAQILPSETLGISAVSRPLLEDLLTEANPELECLDGGEMDHLVAQLRMAVDHYILGYRHSIAFAAQAAEMAPENHSCWATAIQSQYQRAHDSAKDPRVQPALALFRANLKAAIH